MICLPCREREHALCPEWDRQQSSALSTMELAGSALCDCQHRAGYLSIIEQHNRMMAMSLRAGSLAYDVMSMLDSRDNEVLA